MNETNLLKDVTQKPTCLIVGGPDVDARIDLAEQLVDEYEIMIAGSEGDLRERFDQEGIAYWVYTMKRGVNPFFDIFMVVQLIRIFYKVRPTIVHTFDTKPGVFARLAARLAGVPVVIGTLPGLGSLYAGDDLRTRVVRSIYQPLQRLACHLSDLTIFQNSDDALLFTRAGIVPSKKVAVISGSGVDTNRFDPARVRDAQRNELRTSLGISEKDILVMMISRLIRPKGVMDFALAAEAVQGRYPNVHFILVGPDDNESVDALSPDELARLKKTVSWLGVRRDISELLVITDIFVFPTFYREGVPRVLLEAASMGLPIVATRVPGCTEVVRHQVNGFLVSPRDVDALAEHIGILIEQPLMREGFGNISRQRAIAKFDVSVIANQTASIYKRVLLEKGLKQG